MTRIAVLGSGKGSNCRAIAAAARDGELPVDLVLVVADGPEAGILKVAEEFGVPGVFHEPGPFRTKLTPEREEALVERLRAAGAEWVILAGWMRVVKLPMLEAFPGRIVNIHPSLLPKYRGLEAWKQALEAGETVTGCTVHFVDAGVDTGEIIGQVEVPVLPDDTPESLHARIQAAEHRLYVDALRSLFRE